MSDTPRTDDQIGYKESTMTVVGIDFARQLERELQKAQADAAAMRFVLEQVAEIEVHGQPTALALQAASALSPDCGRDYVHRSEVEKAWKEGFDSGKRLPSFKAQEYTNSRARKVATGESL